MTPAARRGSRVMNWCSSPTRTARWERRPDRARPGGARPRAGGAARTRPLRSCRPRSRRCRLGGRLATFFPSTASSPARPPRRWSSSTAPWRWHRPASPKWLCGSSTGSPSDHYRYLHLDPGRAAPPSPSHRGGPRRPLACARAHAGRPRTAGSRADPRSPSSKGPARAGGDGDVLALPVPASWPREALGDRPQPRNVAPWASAASTASPRPAASASANDAGNSSSSIKLAFMRKQGGRAGRPRGPRRPAPDPAQRPASAIASAVPSVTASTHALTASFSRVPAVPASPAHRALPTASTAARRVRAPRRARRRGRRACPPRRAMRVPSTGASTKARPPRERGALLGPLDADRRRLPPALPGGRARRATASTASAAASMVITTSEPSAADSGSARDLDAVFAQGRRLVRAAGPQARTPWPARARLRAIGASITSRAHLSHGGHVRHATFFSPSTPPEPVTLSAVVHRAVMGRRSRGVLLASRICWSLFEHDDEPLGLHGAEIATPSASQRRRLRSIPRARTPASSSPPRSRTHPRFPPRRARRGKAAGAAHARVAGSAFVGDPPTGVRALLAQRWRRATSAPPPTSGGPRAPRARRAPRGAGGGPEAPGPREAQRARAACGCRSGPSRRRTETMACVFVLHLPAGSIAPEASGPGDRTRRLTPPPPTWPTAARRPPRATPARRRRRTQATTAATSISAGGDPVAEGHAGRSSPPEQLAEQQRPDRAADAGRDRVEERDRHRADLQRERLADRQIARRGRGGGDEERRAQQRHVAPGPSEPPVSSAASTASIDGRRRSRCRRSSPAARRCRTAGPSSSAPRKLAIPNGIR